MCTHHATFAESEKKKKCKFWNTSGSKSFKQRIVGLYDTTLVAFARLFRLRVLFSLQSWMRYRHCMIILRLTVLLQAQSASTKCQSVFFMWFNFQDFSSSAVCKGFLRCFRNQILITDNFLYFERPGNYRG